MDLKQKYADKIAKLLAKAESTTPEEAEMLTAKAQTLMAQYAIDEAMIEAAQNFSGAASTIDEEEFVMVGIYRFPIAELCVAILFTNDLKVVGMGGKPHRVVDGKLFKETIVYKATGYKGDLDRARMLFTSLQLQALTAENAWWRENKDQHEWKPKGGHYERRQFLFSFADETHRRLREAKQRGQKAAEKEHAHESDSMALVLASKESKVLAKFEELHPNLRKGRAKSYQGGGWDAHTAGTAAGRRADLGSGGSVGGGRKQLKG